MFYTFIVQIILILIIVGAMNTPITYNKNYKTNFQNMNMIFIKEYLIKNAIDRFIQNNNISDVSGSSYGTPDGIIDYHDVNYILDGKDGTYDNIRDYNSLVQSQELSFSFDGTNVVSSNLIYFELINNRIIKFSHIIPKNKDAWIDRKLYVKYKEGKKYGNIPYGEDTVQSVSFDSLSDSDKSKVYHEFYLDDISIKILNGTYSKVDTLIPVGAIISIAHSKTCPIGWLELDGTYNSGTSLDAYPALQSLYPNGLPDFRDSFLKEYKDDSESIPTLTQQSASLSMKSLNIKGQSTSTFVDDDPSEINYFNNNSETNSVKIYSGLYNISAINSSSSDGATITTDSVNYNYNYLKLWWDNNTNIINVPKHHLVTFCIKHDYP